MYLCSLTVSGIIPIWLPFKCIMDYSSLSWPACLTKAFAVCEEKDWVLKKPEENREGPSQTAWLILVFSVCLCIKVDGYIWKRALSVASFCLPPQGETTLAIRISYLVHETLLKMGLLLKERICSPWERILSFKNSPTLKREINTLRSEWFPLAAYPFTFGSFLQDPVRFAVFLSVCFCMCFCFLFFSLYMQKWDKVQCVYIIVCCFFFQDNIFSKSLKCFCCFSSIDTSPHQSL